MKHIPLTEVPGLSNISRFIQSFVLLVIITFFLFNPNLQAQTWLSDPGNGNWNTATNWDTGVPSSNTGTATFSASDITSVCLSGTLHLGTVQFNAGAPSYSIDTNGNTLDLYGTGILNLSNSPQTFTDTNNGSIAFFNTTTAGNTYFTNTSGGHLTFSNTSQAGSAMILNEGVLTFNNGASTGNASVTNVLGGSIWYNNNASAGNSNIQSVGALTFAEVSTAGNANIQSTGATINFYDGSSAGNSTIALNGGIMTFYDDNSVTFASAGSATINAQNAKVIFDGYSTAGNASLNLPDGAHDTAVFYTQSNAGTASFYVGTGNSLTFNDSSSAVSATLWNNGSVTFSGDNGVPPSSAGWAQITNNGTLQFNDFSTAANAAITTTAGGTLYFRQGALGGTAGIYTTGNGRVDMSYETNPVTFGAIGGTGTIYMGAITLAIGANNGSTTFSGVLSDGGVEGGTGAALVKQGLGSLTLSGNNSFTGGLNIDAGMVVAAGYYSLGLGSVTVNGGTLGLNGPQRVMIGGNYTQTSSGTLQLTLNGVYSSLYDHLVVNSAASLDGILFIGTNNSFLNHDNVLVPLITASNVSGEFSVEDSTGICSVVYKPNEVLLDISADAPSFASLGQTTNQKTIGGALDLAAIDFSNTTLISYLNNQSNAALPGIYDQISPASLTSLYQMGFNTARAQAGLVDQRLSQLFSTFESTSLDVSWNGEGPQFAGDLPASEEAGIAQNLQAERWCAFAVGLGNFGTVTGDGNATGYQFSTGGVVAGLDYRFTKEWAGGLLLGYTQSGTSQSPGTVNVSGGQVGLYGGWKQDSLHLEALFSGGLNTYTTQRLALGGTASGNFQGQQFSSDLNFGYDMNMGQLKVSPFVSGQYTNLGINSFAETGSLAPLGYPAQSEGYLSTDLGATANLQWGLGGGVTLTPSLSAAWEHIYQGNLDSLAAILGPGTDFTVNGPTLGTDAADLGAGLNAQFGKDLNLFAQYQGKVGLVNYTEQNISGGMSIGF